MNDSTSKNDRAHQVMGKRRTDVIPFDQPCELGYWCPVCRFPSLTINARTGEPEYDERLHWSEYKGFLWCEVCDFDYPSALCVPLHAEPDPVRPWVKAGRDAAVSVFLDQIEANRQSETAEHGMVGTTDSSEEGTG
jgi:uncharacterized protein YbaR (Trm112 family)